MKCDYCQKQIKEKPVRKMMKKKKYVFCTEMCFRLHYWQVPAFNLNAIYAGRTISIECPDFRELIENHEEE